MTDTPSDDAIPPATASPGERTAYHICARENLASILATGLEPRIGRLSSALGEAVPAVYLFASVVDAEDALAGWFGDQFEEDAEFVLLAVRLSDGLRTTPGAGYEVVVLDPVAPDAIRIENPDFGGFPPHSAPGS